MGRLCTSSALSLTFLLTLSLFPSLSLQEKNCTYPDGSIAPGYHPCDQDADHSPCCLNGEICLTSGLCYGGVGVPYRGACYGGWTDMNICPRYCSELGGSNTSFANIWPCGDAGKNAPMKYWCGNGDGVPCDTTVTTGMDNGMFITVGGVDDSFLFKGVATAETSQSTGTSTPATASSSATATSTPTDCAAESATAEPDNSKLIAVGAGIGVPLFLLAMAMGSWAFWERAKRRSVMESSGSSGAAMASAYQHWPDAHGARRQTYIAELQTEPAEMPAGKIEDSELDASGRFSIRRSRRS